MTFFQSGVVLYAIIVSMLAVCLVSCSYIRENMAFSTPLLLFSKAIIILGGSLFACASVSVLNDDGYLYQLASLAKNTLPYHVFLFLLLLS